jgi:hypothetical protein
MPDLTGLPMLDIAIGLSFLYFLLSIVCSSIGEIISAVFKLRAKNLEVGLRVLLGSKEAAAKFYEDWRIGMLRTPKWFGGLLQNGGKPRGRKASYIPPDTAALVLLDTLAPAAAAVAKKIAADSDPSQEQLCAVKKRLTDLPDGKAKEWLADVIVDARGDLDKIRAHLEDAFNAVMDRATGWYKRRTQVILFVVALAVAAGLNADTINVADRLARDEAVRAHVVAQAQKAGNADTNTSPTAKDVEEQINTARGSGLPLGWAGENIPNYSTPAVILEKIAGLGITAIALLLGAPFWFDVLGRFARLRSSGNRIGTPKEDDLAPSDRDDRLRAAPARGARTL